MLKGGVVKDDGGEKDKSKPQGAVFFFGKSGRFRRAGRTALHRDVHLPRPVMPRTTLCCLLALLPVASYAYMGTAPIVAWSSHR